MSSFQAAPRPSLFQRARTTWFANPRADLLSGLVVALALIPEAISFSIIAGVDPKVGLYASFSIAVIIAFAGGRPGMISAATGAMALVLVPLVERARRRVPVRRHGPRRRSSRSALGALGVGRLMRFVPRTVMIGFVNALAILIFLAQVPHITGGRLTASYALVAPASAIIYLLPAAHEGRPVAAGGHRGRHRRWRSLFGLAVPHGRRHGRAAHDAARFRPPDVPFTLETLPIIAPVSLTLAFVGLLESLLTAQLIDDITDTNSDKDTASPGARASPTSPPASSAAWPAAP